MLLSIIVPVYNVEEYLNRCIDSLLKTNGKFDYEIILIDDGSKDNSGVICDGYSEKFDYIHTFHKANGGLSDARNEGLKCAVGEYVVFIDSDDYVEEDAIEKICKAIEEKKCDIFCTDYYSLSHSKRNDFCYTPTKEVLDGKSFLLLQLKNQTMISSVVQNIYRREFLIQNQLFFKKGIYHEDEEWFPRVFLEAEKVQYLDLKYYVYVIRDNSIMQQKNYTKHINDFIDTMNAFLSKYRESLSSELYCLFKDSFVDKYLSIYARGQFNGKNPSIVLPKSYLSEDIVYRKTKIKVLIFSISKRLFCKVSRIYNSRR